MQNYSYPSILKYTFSGYGVGSDAHSSFSLSNSGGFSKRGYNSSSALVDSIKKDILNLIMTQQMD